MIYFNLIIKEVRIPEQVKTLYFVSGFHWSALKFSQVFALVFTRLWRHREHALFFNCNFITYKMLPFYAFFVLVSYSLVWYSAEEAKRLTTNLLINTACISNNHFQLLCLKSMSIQKWSNKKSKVSMRWLTDTLHK